MKTQLTNTPPLYEIEKIYGNKCFVAFYDLSSLIEKTIDNENIKECDVYKIELVYNTSYIENNYYNLLNQAKEDEYNKLAKEIRDKRDKLLQDSDYLMNSDVVCDKNKVVIYRQALRDITNQAEFPYSVVFPELEL